MCVFAFYFSKFTNPLPIGFLGSWNHSSFPHFFEPFFPKTTKGRDFTGPFLLCICQAEATDLCVVLRPHSKGAFWVPGIKGRSLKVTDVSTGTLPLKRAERKWRMFQLTDVELSLRFNSGSPGWHLVPCGVVQEPSPGCVKGRVLLSDVGASLAWCSLLVGWPYIIYGLNRAAFESGRGCH